MTIDESQSSRPCLHQKHDPSNRRLFDARLAGSVLAVAVVVLLSSLALRALGQSDPKAPVPTKELRAQRFVLVDENDRKLASLERQEDGRPALVLWNKEETAAASIVIDKGGMPRIVLESGDAEVSMGFMDAGSPVLGMLDAKGNRRLAATVFMDNASLTMYDDQKRERWLIGVNAKGQPIARVKDEKGNLRAGFAHDESGVGLTLSSEDDRSNVVLQVHPQGQCDVAILRGDGKRGVAMQSDADGCGNVAIFEDKQPIWQARKP